MVVGFIWMVSLAIVGTNFEQTMAAFFFTIFGLVFWALAYHYSSKRKNMMYQLKKEEKKTQKKQHDFIRH